MSCNKSKGSCGMSLLESMECVNEDVQKKKKKKDRHIYTYVLMDGMVEDATNMESLHNQY